MSLQSLGFKKTRLLWCVVAAGVGLPLGFLEYWILKPVFSVAVTPLFALRVFVETGFLVSLGEELVFRGIVQRIWGGVFGEEASLILTSLVFSLLHLGWRSYTEIIFVFFAGLVLGYAYQKTSSLAPPVALHAMNNFTLLFIAPLLMTLAGFA